MQKRYFTFLYVPSRNTGLKTVRVHKWLVYGLTATVLALVITTGVATSRYAAKVRDGYQTAQLDAENRVLRAEVDAFRERVDQLERQVQQNFDFQKKARIIARLDDLNEDIAEVGVGGPESGYLRTLNVLDAATRDAVTSLQADVDKLIRQARLQREGYSEILDQLSSQQELRNTTPSIRPVHGGYLSSRFGRRMHPLTGRPAMHYGVDYSARLGSPIVATADGIVTFAGKWQDFGITVEVSHGNDFVTRYAHCSKLVAKKGQRVRRGDVIARVGSSGSSTATHVHYEILHKGEKKNPLRYVVSGDEITD